MAEFCRDCYLKMYPETDAKKLVMSDPDDLDICEGCGQLKRVVIRERLPWRQALAVRWENLGYWLRNHTK